MSYDVPPGPPPSGPPPGGQVETLDSHGGDRRPNRSRRTTILGGVAAVAVVAVGGVAWAAYSFFSTGAQPAEALPDSTIAYASIDLDPSGGQKIEALRTLKKFPAFADMVGLDTDDDVRQWIVEQFQDEMGCADLDYHDDVEPWLGNRFALAAVDTGADDPTPVFVIQVSDADRADAGLTEIRDCAGGGSDDGAWTVDGEWLLLGEDQDTVDGIAEAAADGTLADDDDFRRWTDAAGGSGIVSLYAAPAAGSMLAEELAGEGGIAELTPEDQLEGFTPEETLKPLKDFQGAAATLRFDDGGLEFEVAADIGDSTKIATGDAAGEAVASLPADTAVAAAVSLGDGWFERLFNEFPRSDGTSTADLLGEGLAHLGLDLPEDADTLAGDAIAIAIDGGADLGAGFLGPEVSAGAPGPSGVGIKVLGDADRIDEVLDRVRAAANGADGGLLDSDAGEGAVAIGPDADYRQRMLTERGLGDSDSFGRVIEHSDEAAGVLYIDFDAGENWLTEFVGDDSEVRENVEPLDALGLSVWLDGDTAHGVLKITSD